MKVTAALLCGGSSSRYGSDKLFADLEGEPLWIHAYRTFLAHPKIDAVGLIGSAATLDQLQQLAPEAAFVVEGGSTRAESSRQAIAASQGCEILLIHDGARPFVTADIIDRVLDGIERVGAAAAGTPVVDLLRSKDSNSASPDRNSLYAMQTPQGARWHLFRDTFQDFDPTWPDDMAPLLAAGIPFEIVLGSPVNRKITHPGDLPSMTETRTGLGYDIHTFSTNPDRKLMLGGVHFPNHAALEGHSDADVLLHAVVDALLGAASLGDIGEHFPPSDPQWKDCSSLVFLRAAKTLLSQQKWRIVNIDVSVIAESPKIRNGADAIRTTISQTLEIRPDRVNVKATTNERLGAIGRGEGIAAFATATLARTSLG